MKSSKAKSKRQSSERRLKKAQDAHAREAPARGVVHSAERRGVLDEQWLRQMRGIVRCISRKIDEIQLVFRAMEVLQSKEAVRRWFNGVVTEIGARPIDLLRHARGRRAVLRELDRIEHQGHS
jgi:uncharacterized protein (DUF2384 family)